MEKFSSKVYELRKYTIKPDAIGKYKQLTTEQFHLRTKHSKLLGFWFSDVGSKLFLSVHIWEYGKNKRKTFKYHFFMHVLYEKHCW